MKFNVFNTSNCEPSLRKGQAVITFNTGGNIALTKNAAETLGLKAGDKVALLQDTDNPKDWYLSVGDAQGFELRKRTENGSVQFNNVSLVDKVLRSLGISNNASFPLVAEPQNLEGGGKVYPIITSRIKAKETPKPSKDDKPYEFGGGRGK